MIKAFSDKEKHLSAARFSKNTFTFPKKTNRKIFNGLKPSEEEFLSVQTINLNPGLKLRSGLTKAQ